MSLIFCPECAAEVSSSAPACMRCGYPLAVAKAPLTAAPSAFVHTAPQPAAPATPAAMNGLSYFVPWKRYAQFSGRARRKEYWTFSLINLVIGGVLYAIGALVTDQSGGSPPVPVLYLVFVLAGFIPSLAVSTRRLHDTNKSGWLILLTLIPLVGGIVLLAFMCLASDPGDNKYGPPVVLS